MSACPFDGQPLDEMRATALLQAGGLYPNPSVQSDAMTALYMIAALTKRIADLEARASATADAPESR